MEQSSNIDSEALYQIISQISGKPLIHCDTVRDENGAFVAENSANVCHWQADVNSLLAYALSCDLSSEDEVANTLQRLRNKIACREDGIPTEICTSCADIVALWFHEVIGQRWRDEAVPKNWGSDIIIPA
ncbi:unnamed protein product [Dibothriocephalus latus]|uniref:Uncharacterized protein n=1 Tax=Dibothriocephalus latus TaxID=60516 RepID=A0A3P7MJC9_DIBLA|nr:unnamed protein product [Dibothriocephalus latus]